LGDNKKDAELISRLPDEEAWREFVEKYTNLIFYAIRKRLPEADQDTVHNIYADFMLHLWEDNCRRLRGYQGRCKLSWWLVISAGNFAIGYARKKRVETVEIEDDEGEEGFYGADSGPDEVLAKEEGYELVGRAIALLRQIIQELEPEDRAILAMRYREGMSADQIARALRVSRRTFYRRMEGIMNALRTRMSELGIEGETLIRALERTEGEF
jgi:RNA polymerase sigma factor (sigma-70 family)